MKLNLDEDIMAAVQRALDPQGPWFSALPAKVQIRKLLPYIEKQHRRDVRRLKVLAA